MDTTLDGLLNRRVTVEQPAQGFRIAVDTVLLAAAVDARAGQKVADFGCGVGGAMLCLACRVPGIHVTGFEIQPELAVLCRANIERNKFQSFMQVVESDVTKLRVGGFQHVMMNPPYHEETRHDVSMNNSKRIAHAGKDGDLALWIAGATRMLTDNGALTLIHRADRSDEIIAGLSGRFKTIDTIFITPKSGVAPKRVIMRAHKTGSAVTRRHEDLILHNADGSYGGITEDILRRAAPLPWVRKP